MSETWLSLWHNIIVKHIVYLEAGSSRCTVKRYSPRLEFTKCVTPSPEEIVWVYFLPTTICLLEITNHTVKPRQDLMDEVTRSETGTPREALVVCEGQQGRNSITFVGSGPSMLDTRNVQRDIEGLSGE